MWKKTKQGNRISYDTWEFVVDTIEDLKTLPQSPMGSKAFVIATKDTYMVDSTRKTWHSITSEAGSVECDCVEESTVWDEIPLT